MMFKEPLRSKTLKST